MKKETIKKLGEYFLDVSKIILLASVINPIVAHKVDTVSYIGAFFALMTGIGGIILYNKGNNDE